MTIPAVPGYVKTSLDTCSQVAPGHRFLLYCSFVDQQYKFDKNAKRQILEQVKSVGIKELIKELRDRQIACMSRFDSASTYQLVCTSTSPFTTGLGNEHPVENGFAFLTPYGIPYLAGSGVKGVLRRAAEVAALFKKEYSLSGDLSSFSLADVWLLFGFEGDSFAGWPSSNHTHKEWREALYQHRTDLKGHPSLRGFITVNKLGEPEKQESFLEQLYSERNERKALHIRGALSFWDVFPYHNEELFAVDVMTPHYSHYYQNGQSPHDSGQPNPIPFLTIRSGAQFNFNIQCDLSRLPRDYDWQKPLRALFEFACKWQGFGAKTAVGYGALRIDEEAEKKLKETLERQQKRIAEELAKKADREKLATLTEQGKLVHEFRKLFESEQKKKYVPNGPFVEKRQKFLKTVQTWERLEDKLEAMKLLEETFAWGKQEKQFKEFKKWKASLETKS